MADSYVQVAPDSSGKQIDSQAVINTSGNTVYRQTIVIADPNVIGNMVNVDNSGSLQVGAGQLDRLNALMNLQTLMLLQLEAAYGGNNGFMPLETPSFLVGA